tara:strand:+ start:295 stop:663 length:369 start_codon:yes stop_codon:yes gene_type:complete
MTISKRRGRKSDMDKAKGISIAELKYPKSEEVKKAIARNSKLKFPPPNNCEHDRIDYKAMAYMAKHQLQMIKALIEQIANMEAKFKLSQEGVNELTKVYSDRILECNNIIKDLHGRLIGRAN